MTKTENLLSILFVEYIDKKRKSGCTIQTAIHLFINDTGIPVGRTLRGLVSQLKNTYTKFKSVQSNKIDPERDAFIFFIDQQRSTGLKINESINAYIKLNKLDSTPVEFERLKKTYYRRTKERLKQSL